MLVRAAIAGHFVVKLREDSLEDLLEDVHSGVCEYFVLQIDDQISERACFRPLPLTLPFFFDQRFDRPGLAGNVVDCLACKSSATASPTK